MATTDLNTGLLSLYSDVARPIESLSGSDLAEEAFNEALKTFNDVMTRDPSKKAWLQSLQCSRIEDVQLAASSARSRYERGRGNSKVRNCLASFSQKVLHYGKVLDVFVQHHPEYVSLVWGSMRILFMGVAEQENLLVTITEGLNQISDSLPRAEISARLYPIPRIKTALSKLYAIVIKFLIRAVNWYSEGKLVHTYHAITRPAALRYDGLIKQIREISDEIYEIATSGSHAALRDMHLKVRSMDKDLKAVRAILSQFQQLVANGQAINKSTRSEINLLSSEVKKILECVSQAQQTAVDGRPDDTAITAELGLLRGEVRSISEVLSQVQSLAVSEHMINNTFRATTEQSFYKLKISQVFAVLTNGQSLDPQGTLITSRLLRDRRRRGPKSANQPISHDHTLQQWNDQQQSAMVILRGAPSTRLDIKDFCVDVVEYLRRTEIAVLWALKGLDSTSASNMTEIDILKNLIHQALQIRSAKQSTGVDTLVAQQLPNFLNASSKEDWLTMLKGALSTFAAVYIVVDTKVISPSDPKSSTVPDMAGELINTFLRLSERFSSMKCEGNATSIVKVVVAHYGAAIPVLDLSKATLPHFVVQVGRNNHRQTRATKRPPRPQDAAFVNSSSTRTEGLFSSASSSGGIPRRSKKKNRS
ncbi:hypothetical protein LTR84_003488 [Exophiala bonariae]|uniref:DUF7708 domain-containing protein n=1 Tax=Exophiala bonariae TaxID=1690606 RepID=A0AAV9N7D9_9EURO|nr:hypothetical protein LTR84_003488 [Exophiala bonariae]